MLLKLRCAELKPVFVILMLLYVHCDGNDGAPHRRGAHMRVINTDFCLRKKKLQFKRQKPLYNQRRKCSLAKEIEKELPPGAYFSGVYIQ